MNDLKKLPMDPTRYVRHLYTTQILPLFPALTGLLIETKLDLIGFLVEKGVLDWPTQASIVDILEDVDVWDLQNIAGRGMAFDTYQKAHSTIHIAGECHASTALNWTLHPSSKIVTGFSGGWAFHSWLYYPKTRTIYECTPILRETYYGYKIQSRHEFLLNEAETICRLWKEGRISDKHYKHFVAVMNNNIANALLKGTHSED